ncbi:Hypothetical protein AA314_08376 [Archangium gephyra]|uniref:Uncharacterized protein n=1 Tax=Archangium gephyra TaxID=48 RepID=A0AAC8TIF9_9BACT|nr:Hypothetical protein AA314_08376 [Archangium gephyra]
MLGRRGCGGLGFLFPGHDAHAQRHDAHAHHRRYHGSLHGPPREFISNACRHPGKAGAMAMNGVEGV